MTTPTKIVKTIVDLSSELGVSRKTLYQWKKRGMPVNRDGSFDLSEIIKWRALWDTETLPAPDAETPLEGNAECNAERLKWDTEFRKYRAKNQEIDYRTKKGDLIPRPEVLDLLTTRAAELKRELLDRARRLALRCAHKDSKAIHEILEADSISILEKYSR